MTARTSRTTSDDNCRNREAEAEHRRSVGSVVRAGLRAHDVAHDVEIFVMMRRQAHARVVNYDEIEVLRAYHEDLPRNQEEQIEMEAFEVRYDIVSLNHSELRLSGDHRSVGRCERRRCMGQRGLDRVRVQ